MSPPPDFPLLSQKAETVIELPQRLSVLEAVKFDEFVRGFLEKPNAGNQLTLDCHQVEFIDSSGIGALVRIHNTAQSHHIRVVLANLNQTIYSVLAITGLHEAFEISSPTYDRVAYDIYQLPQQLTDSQVQPHPSVQSRWKRGLDILGSLVGLIITGLLFIPIAIAIKLDSPGPILFKQTRCGWMGHRFTMLKFRSMCEDAEAKKAEIKNEAEGAIFKNKNDPRVTRVGRFLRRTSLDELPQFWNVLRGDMSLVGTRPPTPDEVAKYDVPAWQRLDVKPGMTGEWQVNGRSEVKNFNDIIQLDLRYQSTWNHRHDLKLILQTILIVFRKNSGAL
ncbi:MAG: anti-sigma factor antagonist [Synechocystis sp.]|nr:anti-sigma factor antagonist [Synechocystis sp.]